MYSKPTQHHRSSESLTQVKHGYCLGFSQAFKSTICKRASQWPECIWTAFLPLPNHSFIFSTDKPYTWVHSFWELCNAFRLSTNFFPQNSTSSRLWSPSSVLDYELFSSPKAPIQCCTFHFQKSPYTYNSKPSLQDFRDRQDLLRKSLSFYKAPQILLATQQILLTSNRVEFIMYCAFIGAQIHFEEWQIYIIFLTIDSTRLLGTFIDII